MAEFCANPLRPASELADPVCAYCGWRFRAGDMRVTGQDGRSYCSPACAERGQRRLTFVEPCRDPADWQDNYASDGLSRGRKRRDHKPVGDRF